MLNQLKSILHRAASARTRGEAAESERLFKEAAAQAEATESIERAEALTGVAQARRDKGDSLGASIYYAEAITLLRTASATTQLAHALRHAAEIRSEMKEYGVAGTQIEEAIRLYRSLPQTQKPTPSTSPTPSASPPSTTNAAPSQAWAEAEQLYAAANIPAGVTESQQHRENLASHP